jgi:hypothetical protein
MSEAVEEKVADEVRRHRELHVEDMEMAQVRADHGPRGGRGGASVVRRSEGGDPSGIEPARSRVRAEVFCQWPARLNSAGECACKATGHARAG